MILRSNYLKHFPFSCNQALLRLIPEFRRNQARARRAPRIRLSIFWTMRTKKSELSFVYECIGMCCMRPVQGGWIYQFIFENRSQIQYAWNSSLFSNKNNYYRYILIFRHIDLAPVESFFLPIFIFRFNFSKPISDLR